jgi:hypothetical protein
MTQDEILDMWGRAGGGAIDDMPYSLVETFAKLVAAKEREVCAEICDRFQARDVGMQPAECAGAIRARK